MNKSFKIFSLSILFLVTIMGAVSALSINPSVSILSQDGNQFNLEITGTPNNSVSIDLSDTIVDKDETEISFSSDDFDEIIDMKNIIKLNETTGKRQIIINYDTTDFDFEFGKEYSITITSAEEYVVDTEPHVASTTLTFEKTPFYEGENKGDLSVSGLDMETIKGFGDDEDYWYPFDEVEITFTVENNGDDDIENIKIETCLLDKEKEKCIFDEDDMKIDDDEFDLDSGDDKDITITLNVDADKLTAGNREYTFYVRAIGEISEGDNKGNDTGDSNSHSVDIITDDKFVIVEDIEMNPNPISCGETMQLTAKVWNIWDEDLDDDEVFVHVYNKELGINEVVEFEHGIDSMDYEKIELSLEMPEDIDEGIYAIKMKAYDKDDMNEDDIFQTDVEEDEASYQGLIKIEGSCIIIPSVSAKLDSEAIAGKDLVIKTTITNTGDKTMTYTLNVKDYESWAELISIEPSEITLDSGESEEVFLTFHTNKESLGDKLFNIQVLSEGEEILKQPVSIPIEEQKGLFAGLTGGVIGSGNTYIWIIGGLNVLLVVIIIIVATKVAKKSE